MLTVARTGRSLIHVMKVDLRSARYGTSPFGESRASASSPVPVRASLARAAADGTHRRADGRRPQGHHPSGSGIRVLRGTATGRGASRFDRRHRAPVCQFRNTEALTMKRILWTVVALAFLVGLAAVVVVILKGGA